MKLIILFSLILVININYSFAQEINDSLKTDSIGIVSPDKASNNGLSGYASKIGYNDFNNGAVYSPMQLIQGKVPGFVVNCLNVNDPDPDFQIQSRGISTLYLSTEPLYIIDGIPLESPDIIPAENIDSIEVLKSLYETALYGIRGANGVVIIKTKKNNSKKLIVSYNTYIYSEFFANKSDYMSASEWRKLRQNWASSTYPELIHISNGMTDYNANTDWRKEISQKKISQAHNLGFYGGYKKTSYSAMLNCNNYNGIIQKTGNTIYSGQLSISQLALKDKLQVDISIIRTDRKYSEINDNPYLTDSDLDTGLKNSNIVSCANHNNPTLPVYNTDGTYGIDTTSIFINPIKELNNTTDKRELKNTLVHIQARYEIIKGLKFSASWSEYKTAAENSYSYYYQPKTTYQISETKETNDQKERLYSVELNYSKSIAFHYFDISLDYSNQRNDINYDYRDSVITNGTHLTSRSHKWMYGNYDIKKLSGSIKYNYKNKYYLSFGILREVTPLYTSDESAQYFPSLSAAWSLGDEHFLTNITWLNELKLRVGYGVGQRMIKFADNSAYGSSIMPSSYVRGEKMQELNMGVDVSLLSNRLCFSADYYNRKTKDGVIIVTGPFFSSIMNEAEIQNKGCEFYIKAQPLIYPIKWTFDFNISFNKNIAISEFIYTYGIKLNDQPVGNFYGHQFAGYSATNQILVYDDNGNTTTNYIAYKKLGNGAPKSFFGFTNAFKYKNFDLSIFVTGALGFDIKNYNRLDNWGYMNFQKTMLTVDPRDITNYSRLQTTDYILEKGGYIKISNISLGYTIHFEKQFVKSAKVYIACNNVALFTKASNVNPEIAGISGLYPGNYYYEKYPETRIFLLGLKVLL